MIENWGIGEATRVIHRERYKQRERECNLVYGCLRWEATEGDVWCEQNTNEAAHSICHRTEHVPLQG